jgi:predicted component of type VI protein secretion system
MGQVWLCAVSLVCSLASLIPVSRRVVARSVHRSVSVIGVSAHVRRPEMQKTKKNSGAENRNYAVYGAWYFKYSQNILSRYAISHWIS